MTCPNDLRLIPYGTTHLTQEESIIIVASLIAMAARIKHDDTTIYLHELANRILTQIETTLT